MAARLIDGKAVAAAVRERVRPRQVAELASARRAWRRSSSARTPPPPMYVRMKREAAPRSASSRFHHEPAGDVYRRSELPALVESLERDDEVDGILVQLPLPDQIDPDRVVAAIDPAKDVDGLTPTNAGLLAHGTPRASSPAPPSG